MHRDDILRDYQDNSKVLVNS